MTCDRETRQGWKSDDRALSMLATAIKVRSTRSTPVAQLLEAVNRALAVGETEIDSLSMNGLHVQDEDVEEVVSAVVSSGVPVKSVSMASNDIGDAGAAALARLCSDVPPRYRCVLAHLDIHGNKIGAKGCQVLADQLKNNVTLSSLNIGSNALGSEGGRSIAQMLNTNSSIKQLVLNNANMTEAGCTALLSAISESDNSVRELGIGSQLLHSQEEVLTSHLSRMLEAPGCVLISLDASSSGISDEGAYMLRGALTGHATLRSLDLSQNRVGITGGHALATLLVGDSSLISVGLRANMIGDEGAEAFKTVLLHNQKLKTLDLRNNNIFDAGLNALAEGMECNASLEHLFVWGNHFGQASLRRFNDLADGRFALVGVFIDVKPFLVDGVFHAAEKLSMCSIL